MAIVDFIIVGLTLGVAAWGYRHGVMTGLLMLVGFGGGAVLGSRLAPLLLDGGLDDQYAPVLAVPGALLCGAVCATVLERIGFSLRRGLRGRGRVDALGGAVLTGLFGLVLVWILAAALARVDGLRGSIRDSLIVEELNAVVPPPGPLLHARGSNSAPRLADPGSYGRPSRGNVRRDPEVRAVKASVAKIRTASCGAGVGGSGWIAADGVVVTNAHVARAAEQIRVQMSGKGRLYPAQAIWYDARNDIALLRTPGVRGKRALPIVRKPKPGTAAAMLGFPGGGPYVAKPARLGATLRGGRRGKRLVTRMKARSIPGNSGGPVVDLNGRVVGMTFAGDNGLYSLAVPTVPVLRALKQARGPVNTGSCDER